MTGCSRIRASWLAAALVLAAAGDSRGDAVPPAPSNCPKGTVGVTGHGGPRCAPEAPKNCPPGWVGQVGGICAVYLCSGACPAGLQCKPASVCFEPHVVYWRFGAAPRTGPEIAAPPYKLDKPETDWLPVDICGAPTSKCPAPSECRPSTVCLPPSVASASPRTPPAHPKPPAPPPDPAAPAPRRGGCAGCGHSDTTSVAAGPLLALVVATTVLWRRRRDGR